MHHSVGTLHLAEQCEPKNTSLFFYGVSRAPEKGFFSAEDMRYEVDGETFVLPQHVNRHNYMNFLFDKWFLGRFASVEWHHDG